MKFIKKLTKRKSRENQEVVLDEFFLDEEAILDEFFLDEEAMPSKKVILDEMLYHPEGEYVLTEKGLCLQYVNYETNQSIKKSQDDNKETSNHLSK